jgi:radical SAM protein with 4Fe4S-binding SPASM domain
MVLPTAPSLRVLAWELTRACPLACAHCRAEAQPQAGPDELDTAACRAVIDDVAAMGRSLLILTGGEPMLRPDFLDVARHASGRGLMVVAAPCGKFVDATAVAAMRGAGIHAISLSIDAAQAEDHDRFRGWPGAFAMVTAAAAAARAGGLPFQVNTTVHRGNVDQLPALAALAAYLGAAKWDVFFLVPTGRGRGLAGRELDAQQTDGALRQVRAAAAANGLRLKVTCAPQSVRVAAEDGVSVDESGATGCLGGRSFAFLSASGQVQICGFLDTPAGSVRERPFSAIWRDSPFLAAIRDRAAWNSGCGACDHRETCGGCRARANAASGDPLAAEPSCPCA